MGHLQSELLIINASVTIQVVLYSYRNFGAGVRDIWMHPLDFELIFAGVDNLDLLGRRKEHLVVNRLFLVLK